MAQKGVQLDPDTFSCSICLDLPKDPVAIPCGHSYCMNCIKSFWDQEDEKKVYSCPQCRQAFAPRPVLLKNTMLAALVEELTKTGLQAASADHCYAGPGDEACDYCTGRKLKALKSCLVCLVSFCEQHLQPHYNVAQLRTHKLVEPSMKLQENTHEHKGHNTVSAAAEPTERQKELKVRRQNIQQRIQDREKGVKLFQQEVDAINRSADKAVKDSEEIFTEMIHLIEKRSSDVTQQVRSQQKTEVRRVKELQEKLKREIIELRSKDAELEQLSHTEDLHKFLHKYPSLSHLSKSTSSINIRPLPYFEDVTATVSEIRDNLQDVLSGKLTKVSGAGAEVGILLPEPEPTTRAGFLKYLCEITMDPNTANPLLLLSEGNRKATVLEENQSYFSHPDRFNGHTQVLGGQSLTGCCYWEVEWRGEGVDVAVAYNNISRAGRTNECRFGANTNSWALHLSKKSYNFWYNSRISLVTGPLSSRVGIYLDHSAGILSFYSVSDTMTPLHRVQTTFTQPLYAGLWLCSHGDSAELCTLK